MKYLITILLFVCASLNGSAQTNFVKNPDFEKYTKCPDITNQLVYARYWTGVIDTISDSTYQPEYFNACANSGPYIYATMPINSQFYQFPHSGNGASSATFYYDKTPPAFVDIPNYRQYIQGRLYKPLIAGKTYCVTFWVNNAEGGGYAQNKIGAYLDNGAINSIGVPVGSEITTLTPQVYSDDIIIDTANWTKLEGSFTAAGDETHITIGCFVPNSSITVIPTNYWGFTTQVSGYLLDDVSVIPIDLKADAGTDTWVEAGKKVQIGRVGDTTAIGLDCKWYKKGALIDSGAVISVNAAAVTGTVDTYVVVQTICGLVKSDTVLVKTTTLSLSPVLSNGAGVRVWPNPSNGTFTITSGTATITPHAVIPRNEGSLHATVYDVLGRIVHQQALSFNNNETSIHLNTQNGTYILELKANDGSVWRERIVVQ